MKTLQIFIIIAYLIFINACTQEKMDQNLLEVPNGDFENWTDLRLQKWSSNSCPFCLPPFETYIVQQDSLAFNGKYCAKFIYNNAYPAWAENKFAISSHPEILTAYVKSQIYGDDTVSVKIKLLKNSVVTDSGTWLGTSTFSNFTLIKIPITQSMFQPDTAIIAIRGGHKLGYPLNNTEFWIDNLELK